MRPRTWFVLSCLFFVAAVIFWRIGDNQRAGRADSQKAATVEKVNSPPAHSNVTSSNKVSSEKESAAKSKPTVETKAKALYPNRLSNTTKTINQLTRDNKAILLRNALIDTRAGRVAIPEHLRAKGDPGSYIVQSRGALDDLFRAELRFANAEVISYVPNNAYLVRISKAGVEKLAGNKSVQSILPYEPYYKLDLELLELAVKQQPLELNKFVRVTWFPGQLEAGLKALEGKGIVVGQDLKSSPFGPESIVSTDDLVALANLSAAQGIEAFHERGLLNDLTRVRLGVSTNTLAVTPNRHGLAGSNILVNVNDSSIDNSHPDLTGRIFPGVGVSITDPDGHGTHVTGIIASSGLNGPSGANVPGSIAGASFRGKAQGANIFSLDIFSGLSDFELQETAALTNLLAFEYNSPLISNNSWGYGSSSYNSAAASYDMAVRDAIPGMTGSQPIVYVFAAGNGGGGAENGQGGSPGSITSPATAKNVISVGVMESFRKITNNIIRPDRNCVTLTNAEFFGFTDSSNELANFSSRGNVGVGLEGTFGRIKPDVVAPGTFIVSTRSQQLDEAAYYSITNFDVQTYPNLVIDPGDTNRFSIFIPDDPCDRGRALSFSIAALPNSSSPIPFPGLQIYLSQNQRPSTDPANFIGTNSVTVNQGDDGFARGVIVYYDIVNTNNIEVGYNLRTSITVTNDYGDSVNGYYAVLKRLNDGLGTNYFYESGSSMSAPAISGMLALVQEFFEQTLPAGSRRTNSPAMMKALLINGARSPNDLLYKFDSKRALNISGWGVPNLTRVLPDILASETDTNRWPIQMFDQSTNNAVATGETHVRNLAVADTNAPLRITLVWTDPPGNPQVGVKLVNDLDLVVKAIFTNDIGVVSTNIYFGNNFSGGGQFTDSVEVGTNSAISLDSVRDVVNNVENVYINGPLNGQYEVSVVARRVNVNAVTGHTNGVVQDYALVISSGNLGTSAPFTVTPAAPAPAPNTNAIVTVITNSVPLLNQRVGANSPLLNLNATGLTDGVANQWNFYVLNNPSNFQNVAFLTFLPPNLSGTIGVLPNSRRNIEADIDMYVSTDATLTNLNPAAIAAADKSRGRFGQELVVYTNANAPVYYVGIKSEDQQAAEFSFFGVASQNAFSTEDEFGNQTLLGIIPAGQEAIPDGTPDKPGGAYFVAFSTKPITIARVIVTNTFSHERFGDLINALTHEENFAVLHNHSFPVTDEAPEGLEFGVFTGIYDDSDLTGTDRTLNSRHTDGPGSLVNFIGQEGVGAWTLTMEDNAFGAVGSNIFFSIFLERAPETNELASGNGFSISPFGIPGMQSRGLTFNVPLNATNMIISIAPKDGPIDTVVRQGKLFPNRVAPGGPYVDKGKIINPPGDTLTVGLTDVPPLKPGPYTLRFFNDGGSAVTLSGVVIFELDLTARSLETFASSGPITILDDAVTNSVIRVDRPERVVSAEVGVRIEHQRISDLVLHLVSPEGTRILLAENRGGTSTNYGASDLTTNFVGLVVAGDANAKTNDIAVTLTSGILNIDYEFFEVPDTLHVYYDGILIFDSGFVSGAGRFTIPYGPGVDTNLVVIVNEGGNPDIETAWEYSAQLLSGSIVHATFSENTNLALVPIKFAIPPFATNFPGSNIMVFDQSGFEGELPGTFAPPGPVDGWTVTTSFVDVTTGLAHTGTNYLELGTGAITRPLPTVANEFYNLKFAYRRDDPATFTTARIALDGVFTNEFIGLPNWIVHSLSFAAPANVTQFDVEGGLANMLFDSFELTKGGDPNYYLPEESLKTLIGENAEGNWKLEIWDNRAGAPLGALASWQLNLTFAATNASATVLTNDVVVTNTVAGSEIKYFIIDVPLFATQATNILVSGGGPLNLLFNQNELPVGSFVSGDYFLLTSTVNGTNVLTTSTVPFLQPGRRYYLGVQNVSPSQTNLFTLSVTFDNTTNLIEVTPLFNAIPISTNLPLARTIQYFQYDLTNSVGSLQFKIFGLSADAELVVRRGQLPSQTVYDYSSSQGGTNDEVITVNSPASGRYYVGVYGFFPTNGIDYTIVATEDGAVVVPTPTFINPPRIVGGIFEVDANTVIGGMYEFQYSTDLITWTTISTTTATAVITTFTDPTSASAPGARFYRLRVVP